MLQTNNNIDFKKVNNNLKQELDKLGFKISNQSCLNLLSRALGYPNYNTAKAILKIDESTPTKTTKTENISEKYFDVVDNYKNYYETIKGIDSVKSHIAHLTQMGWDIEEARHIATVSYFSKTDIFLSVEEVREWGKTEKTDKSVMLKRAFSVALNELHKSILSEVEETRGEESWEIKFFKSDYFDYFSSNGPKKTHLKDYISMINKKELFTEKLLTMLNVSEQEFVQALNKILTYSL